MKKVSISIPCIFFGGDTNRIISIPYSRMDFFSICRYYCIFFICYVYILVFNEDSESFVQTHFNFSLFRMGNNKPTYPHLVLERNSYKSARNYHAHFRHGNWIFIV